ncbi:MAG: orotidine-5'-phosphate decarboxylase [Patescibacteria group bacterium]
MKTIPKTPWLFPEEHAEIVQKLFDFGLLKFSNNRDLPLKNGGTTDVYINLRDARNNPKAIKFITELLARPLNHLHPRRFVEIPDSVSCFAGPLAIKTGIPYLTIREKPKEGRVANANVIGNSRQGEKVCLIDDVITDGVSKIVPYGQCQHLGLHNQALIVLVDRQQGWQKIFSDFSMDMNVWAGMTLHDVRRQLIELGIMQRCSQMNEEKNPLIVALDGKSWEEILPVIDRLRTTGCILKVNDLLFGKGIEKLIPDLSVYGRVMADLKSHDISNTVINTCRRLRDCPPWAVTVHASGQDKMVQAAVDTLKGTPTKVLAITVLTSIKDGCEEVYNRLPMDEVLALAAIADRSGAHGFVCSSEEVGELSKLYPGKEFVIPGLRSPGKDKHDQLRADTPKGAKDNGATKFVMGRQIFEAADPVTEAMRILTEELEIVF